MAEKASAKETPDNGVDYILKDLVHRTPEEEMNAYSSSSFFWRPHTVSVLVCLLIMLFYATFLEEDIPRSSDYNVKRGILASCGVFIAFGITQARDGPIIRPHPVIWRFVLCCSIIYELWLIALLFQNHDDARHWMSYLDPSLGKELPEQDYGGNCLIYDGGNVDNPWHNLWDKMDVFVIAHLLGWWAKTLMLRDYWLTMVLSASFEFLEYTLQHQLPNFSECWWDHWIMDFVICNGGGIYIGMLTLRHLEIKTYNWRDVWSIPTYSGKMRRLIQQFTPISWRKFNWHATKDVKHFLAVLGLIVMFSLAELNVFYLKAALWIPPNNLIIHARLVLFFLMGVVAIREVYDFLSDTKCKRFGQQAWLMCAIVITEVFICVKFLREVVVLLPPNNIVFCWAVLGIGIVCYVGWLFFFGQGQAIEEKVDKIE